MSKVVWCVQHKHGWCATYRGRKPDLEAWSDQTRCGYYVVLRMGDAIREPTCPECRAKMKLPKESKNEPAETEAREE